MSPSVTNTARMRCARRSRVRDKRVGRIHFARKRAVPMGCGAAPHVINLSEVWPMGMKESLLRQIPNIERLLSNPSITDSELYRHEIADAVRDVVTQLRQGVLADDVDRIPEDEEILRDALELAGRRADQQGIRRVVNGTGVILHSNFGRACLSRAAAQAASAAAVGYCSLEYDLEKGARGSRTGCIEEWLRKLTGCESSLIVNNNAAAMLLFLSTFASGGNVIVSRGQLVEIGGAFRLPNIIKQCGCELREVGTTNKTRISDYADAIDGNTRALLKVKSSNYKIIGFTQSVEIKDIAELGAKHNIPVIDNIGSSALVDVRRYGIYDEPFAPQSLKDGADVVSFSGDKLLGGPQCGIVLGRKKHISMMKTHALYRAFRADKMTIAALEATLRVHADLPAAERDIPVLAMLALSVDDLRIRAEKLLEKIKELGGSAEIIPSKSTTGGGTLPGTELDSFAIMPTGKLGADKTEEKLRLLSVPIIGHITEDRLQLDVRTMFEEDFDYIANSVADATK